jgi:beta-phosphoglucomutase
VTPTSGDDAPTPARDGGDRPEPRYEVDPWRVREVGLDPALAGRSESVFALANGMLGLRGTLEEDGATPAHGTFLNGFYESAPIAYGEGAYGFARDHQVLLNVADGKRIRVHVGGEVLDTATGEVVAHERELDLRTGILARRLVWRSPGGVAVEVVSRRLVALARPGVAAIELRVRLLEAPDGRVDVRLVSTLEAHVENEAGGDAPRLGSHLPRRSLGLVACEAHDGGGALAQRTRLSGLALGAAVRHAASVVREPPSSDAATERVHAGTLASEAGITAMFAARLSIGDELGLEKVLGYARTPDHPEAGVAAVALAAADEAVAQGFEALAREQAAALDAFWARADIELDGDDALQQGVRFNLFSIFQSTGRDGRTGLAAKGLSGEGYEGHFFWDTEVFALPFLAYAQPRLARSLLAFRIATLPQARARAREMSEDGALYPWRTINGEEASAYFPAGTAQYHINADIALALIRYVQVTGDRTILLEGGAELLLETARLWMSLGARVPAHGNAFCLNEVTGPDEYTALVNNNAFTNLMAQAHLRHAARVAEELARTEPRAWARITAQIGVREDEPAAWLAAAADMRIPYDTTLGIHLQDDAFLDREPWDLAGTPPDHFPLLLHYHPLVIYRHQVLKQADVVLAQVLLSSEFTPADKRRNFAYYDPLTTGDSSLSPSVQAVAAAELGQLDHAYRYFMRTARMDLDDVNGNTAHGVHIAAMAGAWMGLVAGFAGLRDDDGSLRFAPRLPAHWRRLAFRLGVGDSILRVVITPHEAAYTLEAGPPITLHHFTDAVAVRPDQPAVFDLRPRLRAVIFDLDGVLTDTAELHYRAWQRLADEEGMAFDRSVNEQLRGIGRLESLEILLAHAGRTGLSDAEKLALGDRKNGYFRELIAGVTPADLFPGIEALLRDLRAAGVLVGLASASHNAPEVVRRLGIGELIDASADVATIVRGKPDPEIFLAAAAALGVRPEDCAGVEDARAGVEAIKAAAMRAVGVGTDLPGADWIVDDTRRLTREAIARLFEPDAQA